MLCLRTKKAPSKNVNILKLCKNKKFRRFSNYETAKYVEELKLKLENHFKQIPEITQDNFNKEFSIFKEVILKVVKKHEPFKFRSRKQKRLLQKPWITKQVYDAIRRKQKKYNTHFKSGDPHKIAQYKKYANKVNH